MSSLEKSLSDQMTQHTGQLEDVRKEKAEVAKELQQANSELQKTQTTSKDFEKKYEVAQESLSNLNKELKKKVRIQLNGYTDLTQNLNSRENLIKKFSFQNYSFKTLSSIYLRNLRKIAKINPNPVGKIAKKKQSDGVRLKVHS